MSPIFNTLKRSAVIGCVFVAVSAISYAGEFMCGNKVTGQSIWRETVGMHAGKCFRFGPDGNPMWPFNTSCAECDAWANLEVACDGWGADGTPIC